MTIDNVTADTNRDGIDIDCCQYTMVSNCRINAPCDDALCLKSSFALGKNVLTENLTIINCQVSGFKEGSLIKGTMEANKGNGRIKLGTEANGGFRNIAITNCTFRDCRGLALEEVDGGVMENITVSNLTMTNVADYPIYVTTGKRNRGPTISAPSTARNILISNVIATNIDPHSGIQITGLPEQPIEGLRLDNIRLLFKGGGTKAQAEANFRELGTGYPDPTHLDVTPAYGIYARHVRDLELANISVDYVNDEERPAIACDDVSGLEIDDFKAKVANRVAASKFNNVADPVIRNSPVLQALR
jgi:polygalacturonase